MDIYQVSPEKVQIHKNPGERGVLYQMGRLEREGQIEPVVCKLDQNGQIVLDRDHPDYWTYSPELVVAAIALKWDTILVTY